MEITFFIYDSVIKKQMMLRNYFLLPWRRKCCWFPSQKKKKEEKTDLDSAKLFEIKRKVSFILGRKSKIRIASWDIRLSMYHQLVLWRKRKMTFFPMDGYFGDLVNVASYKAWTLSFQHKRIVQLQQHYK